MFRSFHLLIILIVVLSHSCQRSLTTASQPEIPISITILQINDVYEIAPLQGGKVGGLARVAGLLRQLEAENPNTIAVLAGDFFSPSFMGTLRYQGKRIAGLQMIETLNALGLDCATFGNHEFDLRTLEQVEARIDASDFKYCTANALAVAGEEVRPFRQRGQDVAAYELFEFAAPDGRQVKLALVGVVLPFNQQPYVKYLDEESSFATAVAQADTEADLVLGLTHLSVDGDMALAEAVPGLPLFMGGHEHTQLSRYVGRTAITKADANAKTVYIHRIAYYPSTDVAMVHSELVSITPDTPTDPATEAVVAKWDKRVDTLIVSMGFNSREALMTTSTPLLATEHAIRGSQTNYGRLTNEAFRWACPDADVYLFNSGSLRVDDDLSGTITAYDVLRSFPYGGPLVRMTLPGNILQQLLDIGDTQNRGEGGYLQRLLVEGRAGQWQINGVPLDYTKRYRIVLPEFVAKGREANLGFLQDYSYRKEERLREGSLRNDIRDIVIAYLKTQG
jgi:2',3'-cyclic-nucleotide 2'-phosphodiesterase (5'-nucleotidase family)